MQYASSLTILKELSSILRPPRRLSVSDVAQQSVVITAVGGVNSKWDPDVAPHMIEPMNCLSSREYNSVIFVGPARDGKTQALSDCFVTYAVTSDPGDMMLVFPTEILAYDYSKRRLRRLHNDSENMFGYLSARGHDNAIGTTVYKHGMILNLAWPTSSQLAQRDIRYMVMSDYDSMPDDVGGEGEVYGIAHKRTQQFGSAGMTVVESSPKRIRLNVKWEPKTDHEAPPTDGGILSLYNRGDRRRRYWQCLGCQDWFECPALPTYDELETPELSSSTAFVPCPSCGFMHLPIHKEILRLNGKWVPDGQALDKKGDFIGDFRRSKIASFWQKGCGASFQTWQEIVLKYLHAKQEFEATGSEKALITTYNVDQGLPYQPVSHKNNRNVDELIEKSQEWTKYHVPEGVRFLIGLVDVQGNRFEVMILGYGIDMQCWIIDRFAYHWSKRLSVSGEHEPLDPSGHQEDWIALNDLFDKEYPVENDKFGRKLKISYIGCDYGGQDGVASRALNWWRFLRKNRLHTRVRLIKGEGRKPGSKIARVREAYPDTSRIKSRKSGTRGDVPILILNTNELKDLVNNDLSRNDKGPGYVHIPNWIEDKYLSELVAESRGPKGWTCKSGVRNETWDLLVYGRAICIYRGAEAINWQSPPRWASNLDKNQYVIGKKEEETVIEERPVIDKAMKERKKRRTRKNDKWR